MPGANDTSSDDGFGLPDDAPEPPAGFNEPHHHDPDALPRFTCLVCDDQYLEGDELKQHVTDAHSLRDLYRSCLPINLPEVAWYTDESVPITVYTSLAARYADRALDIQGKTPAPAKHLSNNQCPVCGVGVNSTHPATLAKSHPHDRWEVYTVLREQVPAEYEHSPLYDDNGSDDPAASVWELQPGDVVTFRADGWQQSLGTPRGQTRDSISDDDPWDASGIVMSVDDDRGRPSSPGEPLTDRRVVYVRAETALSDDPVSVALEPRGNDEVKVSLRPQVTQPQVSQQTGHGSAGNTIAYIRDAPHIDRVPWHERDANKV